MPIVKINYERKCRACVQPIKIGDRRMRGFMVHAGCALSWAEKKGILYRPEEDILHHHPWVSIENGPFQNKQ